MTSPPTIPALILAAGASTRLGQPKQLVRFQNQTLLARAIQTAREAHFAPIIVIIGHDPTNAIQNEATRHGAKTAQNPHWHLGLGTSIRTGLTALSPFTIPHSPFSALLLMLCDQPHITARHLDQLRALATPENLVAAAYNATIGPPAIIGRRFFPELLQLPDDHGAKPLLLRHPDSLLTLPLPEAAIDLDTPADLPKDDPSKKGQTNA